MMHSNCENNGYQVNLNLPYPPVQAKSCCKEYARAMLSNIGSDNSEMGAVSLYFYDSVILNPQYKSFAQCFHDISIVEMRHLNIFATLACQMGLDPRLWSLGNNQKCCYWTPAYNCYSQNVREVIENAIKREQEAIQQYVRQAETIQDTNIVQNLERIILDERHHIEIFRSMLIQLCPIN